MLGWLKPVVKEDLFYNGEDGLFYVIRENGREFHIHTHGATAS
jgi:hypothetical protein